MTDLLIILGVFLLIVVLLRLRLNLGWVMLIAAAVLGLLTGVAPLRLVPIAFRSLIAPDAVSLILALALIMVLENILRKTGTLQTLVGSLQRLLGDNRAVMALMPAIIGILPSAGGARFSAPMVEESSNGCLMAAERKSFVNYWFRHIWEYVSPLYPGFILAATVAGISMGSLFRWQFLFPPTVLAAGIVYGFRGVAATPHPRSQERARDIGRFALSFAPIAVVMVLVIAVGVNIALALTGVVIVLLVAHRYTPARIVATVRESMSLKTLFMVAGVLVFRGVMEASGVVDTLPGTMKQAGVPVVLILFAMPFVVGLITGITVAYVGATFPLLLPLIGGVGHPDMPLLAFAFAAGFAGVMFSPVHLCLVLTRDYFKSALSPIYRTMAVPETAVVLVALAQVVVVSSGLVG
jgi:hypothetical protein